MRKLFLILSALFLISSCATNRDEPVVSRLWEMQSNGHYVFESNNPHNTGLVSHKSWSGFHQNASYLAVEYTRHTGGRGMLFGLKIELDETLTLPVLAVDHKGRYNFIDPETQRAINTKWIKLDGYTAGKPLLLEAKRQNGDWVYYIEGQQLGNFPGNYSNARYGVMVYTTYGHDSWGAPTDFPGKKIHVEIKVLEER
ncbi:MAG: hypothetical protein B6241_13535 [Spirochaetaceae bacterium 4572_59]|nr:MAG: hypothetical protein B6241_13535 [Spirochaetaceae bacterium 4572_59]